MKIIMQRDSVCMGDDCNAPHQEIFEAETFQQLHQILLEKQYYPTISGNNVVWVLTSSDCWDIYSYFTKTDTVIPNQNEKNLKVLSPDGNFYLKYYSSPLVWQKKILQHFGNNQRLLYLDGWAKEYLYCEELMKQK